MIPERSLALAVFLASLCFLPDLVDADDPAAGGPEEAPSSDGARQPSSPLLSGVRAPDGFEVQVFAAPPDVSYPTGIAAAPTGEVFVAIDKNSSLDRAPGRGSIVRCVDDDDDGVADRFDAFVADIDSPRGMCFVGDRLYVVHPPFLSAFVDDDGDGTSDRQETLVRGMGFDLGFRGADHTSNGVRMGIDGWLYLAIGDYGMVEATGTDGSALQLRGGGILRVRPDGSELELYARGLRNVYDIAVGPTLDGFTRDNTNDGGGWDIRVSHITQSADFGYPTLFRNFGDEIVPPLAIHGGGSGTSALYLDEPGFPAKFGDALYTCDWGRNQVYRHDLERRGATYRSGQEEFLAIPRPTDLDVDGRSRLYVGSWKDGMYNYAGKPIGFVARVTHAGAASPAFPDLAGAADDALLAHLASRSQVCRIQAQHEILRRGERPAFSPALEGLAAAGEAPLAARVAAIFTLKQLRGRRSHGALLELAGDAAVREFALRALADRRDESDQVPVAPFIRALDDSDPRVRLQALVGLGRLGRPEAAAAILPLTEETDVLLRHTAVRTLVSLRAVRPCLDALVDGASSSRVEGCLRVLRRLHEMDCVDGLIGKLGALRDASIRIQVLKALVRLYHTEAEWKGKWWGTRPDTRGPFYDLATWDGSARIAPVLQEAIEAGDVATTDALLGELRRHRVHLEGLSGLLLELARKENALRARAAGMLLEERSWKPEYLEVFRDVASSPGFDGELRRQALLGLASFPDAAGLDAAVRILSGDDPRPEGAWGEFVRLREHRRHIDFFIERTRADESSVREVAYGVLLNMTSSRGRRRGDVQARVQGVLDEAWKLPDTRSSLLRAIGALRLKQYSEKVRSGLDDEHVSVRAAATVAAAQLGIDTAGAKENTVEKLPAETVLAGVLAATGDRKTGRDLFTRQRCGDCHTVSADESPRGPFLGGIATRYSRRELAESVLRPGATIAQGFATNWFILTGGEQHQGFVSREAANEVEIRKVDGDALVLAKEDIVGRGTSPVSIMPEGLVNDLTVAELASLLAYLESLGK